MSNFGLNETKTFNTPMSITDKINNDVNGKNVDTKVYRGMIGSLLYLTVSRPNISYNTV